MPRPLAAQLEDAAHRMTRMAADLRRGVTPSTSAVERCLDPLNRLWLEAAFGTVSAVEGLDHRPAQAGGTGGRAAADAAGHLTLNPQGSHEAAEQP